MADDGHPDAGHKSRRLHLDRYAWKSYSREPIRDVDSSTHYGYVVYKTLARKHEPGYRPRPHSFPAGSMVFQDPHVHVACRTLTWERSQCPCRQIGRAHV